MGPDMNVLRENMNRRFYMFCVSQADEKVIKLKKSSVQPLSIGFLSKLEAGGCVQSPFLLSTLGRLDKAPAEKAIKISQRDFCWNEQRCFLLSPVSQNISQDKEDGMQAQGSYPCMLVPLLWC